MEIVKVYPTIQMWLYPRDIQILIGKKRSATTSFLSDFRKFVEKRPNYFNPIKPMIEDGDAMYNYFAILHYFENKQLLDAGTRSISFKEDLTRLKEAYF